MQYPTRYLSTTNMYTIYLSTLFETQTVRTNITEQHNFLNILTTEICIIYVPICLFNN